MTDLEKIKSILMHEIGHFIIDLLLIKKHSEISIKEVLIRNYECENVSWCGWVELVPKSSLEYSMVVKNASLTAFKFFSLVSGCFFQNKYDLDKFNNCFSFKKTSIGKGDHDKFWEIPFKLRSIYEITENDKRAFYKDLNIIVFKRYFSEILKLTDFQNELDKFANKNAEIIFNDYLSKNKPKNYSFIFEGEKLTNLSKELTSLIINNGFKDVLDTLHFELTSKINNHIIKKPNL